MTTITAKIADPKMKTIQHLLVDLSTTFEKDRKDRFSALWIADQSIAQEN